MHATIRLLALTAASILTLCVDFAFSDVHRVAGNSSTVHLTLASASPHDTILLAPGDYREPEIVIERPLTLLGSEGTVFTNSGKGNTILVRSDSVTIRGIGFQDVPVSYIQDNAAIRLDNVRHCTIEDNSFEDNFFAVYAAKSSYCTISNNRIRSRGRAESQNGNGIHLWSCRNMTITHNSVFSHRDGIYLEFVKHSTVRGNYSEGNVRYGLHFMFSDSCHYERNTFTRNGAGVAVMYSKYVTMLENSFTGNWGPASYGLLLKDISNSRIEKNSFLKNTVGIHAEGCSRSEILNNQFTENGWGIKLMANCVQNNFAQNNFVANTFPVATNSRNSYSTFTQNYWSEYSGYDLDRDGLGDVPFRPVRLSSLIVERIPTGVVLMRSTFIEMLDLTERLLPSLTPEALVDTSPSMEPYL